MNSERWHVVAKEARCQNITSKLQSSGETQIVKNGLMHKIELASNKLESMAKQLQFRISLRLVIP